MVEGKNEEMSTAELSGGARIHYIFQSIFVKSLEVCVSIYMGTRFEVYFWCFFQSSFFFLWENLELMKV